jgi:ribosomal protein S18 acetylase RimI-like enzyme
VLTIRRLDESDVAVLELIAREAPEFDMDGRTDSPLEPLDREAGRVFLSHPDVLYWVAEQDGHIEGFLLCYVQYLWHAPAREVMLYDIGVRSSVRRRGVGRALTETMEAWMRENGIEDVWVPADNPGAEAFYRACGFVIDDEQAVMMSKVVSSRTDQEQQ